MKVKWSKLLALLLVFGLLAAACGDSDGDGTATPTTQSGSDSTTAETSPPTTISVVPETTVPPETGPVYGGKVTLGMEAETPGLRPWEDACASSCDNIRFSIFDQLFVVDTKFNPIPFLAIDIAPNDDFTVWVMNVREGVKFHNGVDFNAQTIADMFPIQAAGAISASLIGTSAIVGVEATGEYEVTYTLSRPNAPFPDFLATQSVGTVFDPTLAVSDPDGYQQNPVGTGPFVMANRDIDNETLLVRNENYWLTDQQGNLLPYLDEIAFRPIPDEGTRVSSLLSGTINALQTLRQGPIRDLRDARDGGEEITMFEFQGNDSGGGMFNVLVPPFDDLRVRRGLTHLNNQEAVIEALGGTGISFPGTQFFNPDSPWFSQAVADSWIQFDVPMGTALVQEYVDDPERSDGKSVGDSIDVELSCPPDPTLIAAMQVIEAVWSSTGLVNVTLTQFDQPTHINNALGAGNDFIGTHQAHCWRVANDSDPSTYLNSAFAAPTPALAEESGIPFSPINWSNYFDPEMFSWLVQATLTDDFQTRYDLYEQVMFRLSEQAPIWYSGHTATVLAVADGVIGLDGFLTPEGELAYGFNNSQGNWHYVQIVS